MSLIMNLATCLFKYQGFNQKRLLSIINQGCSKCRFRAFKFKVIALNYGNYIFVKKSIWIDQHSSNRIRITRISLIWLLNCSYLAIKENENSIRRLNFFNVRHVMLQCKQNLIWGNKVQFYVWCVKWSCSMRF